MAGSSGAPARKKHRWKYGRAARALCSSVVFGTHAIAFDGDAAHPQRAAPSSLAKQEVLPCDSSALGVDQVSMLASLSSQLFPSAASALSQANSTAVACADRDVGLMALLVPLPDKRHLPTGLHGGERLREDESWLVVCLPVSCLGHETSTRALVWHIIVSRLQETSGASAARAGEYPRPADDEWPRTDKQAPRLLRLFSSVTSPAVGPEVFIHDDALDGAGQHGPFDLVTVTDKPERAHALKNTLPAHLRLRFLRPLDGGTPWRFKFFDAERYMLSYVSYLRRRGYGDRLVVYADAFDTAWLGCTRDLRRALDALDTKMFFGAEFDVYPSGTSGYPSHAASHTELSDVGGPSGRPLQRCRESLEPHHTRWEAEPVDEHEPCLAVVLSGRKAVYPNGGVYGGRASALEKALRRLLAHQALLPEFAESGRRYRSDGRTHQYLWNQYFLDRPQDVKPDYGGAFVVNLAQRSLAPREFGVDLDTGLVRSVHFQRSVCLAHANGGGWADNTLQLLRSASALRFDTTASAGVAVGELDRFANEGLHADLDSGSRIVVDTSMCFEPMKNVNMYNAVLASMDLLTPFYSPTFQGLQFVVVRPAEHSQNLTFRVQEIQHTPIYTTAGETEPPPAGLHAFGGRNQFDISAFRLRVRPGDCLAFRCQERCDLTYRDLSADHEIGDIAASDAMLLHGRLRLGGTLKVLRRLRRQYMIAPLVEVFGVGFYKHEDGG